MENKVKHLEMIQGVINRMAANSFMLKGWAITLVSGFFALSDKDSNPMYFLVVYIPIFLFWILDGFYLRQERLYRLLFDEIRCKKEEDIDFSMKPIVKNIGKQNWSSWYKCFISKTEISFYLPLALMSLGIIFVTHR